jgi:hypothetical protein
VSVSSSTRRIFTPSIAVSGRCDPSSFFTDTASRALVAPAEETVGATWGPHGRYRVSVVESTAPWGSGGRYSTAASIAPITSA